MSNLKMIEQLCGLAEALVVLVRELASRLAQIEALDEATGAKVETALSRYSHILGTDEVPDSFTEEQT